ncbi:DUF4214 domain-containing protein [Marivita sp. XM-24bin2]|uniref:DUF4214 domain-containing protein n=1 Tax=Marivita sp. XM-24bin2 TaxID=2133951 RepID=UPI000D7A9C0E|nr:DUF4214 domain-containing protein [Marivita sp. XM-24bin2]MCR9110315.1 DUF4214 domain-containing protein [Paracoccaceae bacterium]PWL34454.1 MAG: hypothetical protein DCO97_14525 [Marivita sp. XM-24bin2]
MAILLSSLNSTNGFAVVGSGGSDNAGKSISASGDFNGDGLSDVIVGAPGANKSFIVFGQANIANPFFNLSEINGDNGIEINGDETTFGFGESVAFAGDVNGDGFDDVIISGEESTQSFVLFGAETWDNSAISLSDFDGISGFRVDLEFDSREQRGAFVSSAGDINGDGTDDFLIGYASLTEDGKASVVFGSQDWSSALVDASFLDGVRGFEITDIAPSTGTNSFSGAGDVNGDGLDDLLVGTNVIFGRADWSSLISLSAMDSSEGFSVSGVPGGMTSSGVAVSGLGDINGDGLDDVIFGASVASPEGLRRAGESYVVFGKQDWSDPTIDVSSLNGSNGFHIVGVNEQDSSGFSVSGAGDFNNDGLQDILIGAPNADPNGVNLSGESYIIFGVRGWSAATVDLFFAEEAEVLRLQGVGDDDRSGWAVSGFGDFNGDSVDDIVVSAFKASIGRDSNSGVSYIVFGDAFSGEDIVGSDIDDLLSGTSESEVLSGLFGDDTIAGGGGNDLLEGSVGIDTAVYSGNQNSYSLTLSPTGTTIEDRRTDGNGTDTLVDIEFLDFDTDLTGAPFDLQQFGGATGLNAQDFESFIEFYIAYFNRAPDAVGLNFWGTAFANGTTLEEMATLFVDQDETRATYPDGTSNTDFVTAVYDNVLGRIPDQDGFDFWVDMLNRSEETNVTRDQFILEVLRGVQDGSPDRAYLDTKVDIGAYFAVHRGMSDTDSASAAMALFDGSQGSVNDAVAAIDGFYQDALDPSNGEFLMQLVGVLDNPFA